MHGLQNQSIIEFVMRGKGGRAVKKNVYKIKNWYVNEVELIFWSTSMSPRPCSTLGSLVSKFATNAGLSYESASVTELAAADCCAFSSLLCNLPFWPFSWPLLLISILRFQFFHNSLFTRRSHETSTQPQHMTKKYYNCCYSWNKYFDRFMRIDPAEGH